MDKWQIQQDFWSSFGIPAYDRTITDADSPYPRIEYEAVSASLDVPVTVTASIYYKSSSWAGISRKVAEIEQYIDNMPPSLPIEGGRFKVRIPNSMSFAQRMSDPDDTGVRIMVLNVDIEFLTAH